MWTVVHFVEEDTVDAVPAIWINGNECLWPSYSGPKLKAAIQNCHQPSDSWKIHKVRPLAGGFKFADFNKARMKAIQAESTSDLNSESELLEKKRTTKKKKFFGEASSHENSSDENSLHENSSGSDTSFKKNNKAVMPKPPNRKGFSQHALTDNESCSVVPSTPVNRTQVSIANVSQSVDLLSIPKSNPVLVSTEESGFQRQVLRHLNILNVKVDRLADDINAILLKCGRDVTPEVEPENSVFKKFNFPLKTIEDFNSLEEFLEHEANFKNFVAEIMKIGGSNYKNMVKRIMTKLFTNDLAQQYSWIGFKGKNKFSVLHISRILVVAVQNYCKGVSEAEIEAALKAWLVKAKERERLKKH